MVLLVWGLSGIMTAGRHVFAFFLNAVKVTADADASLVSLESWRVVVKSTKSPWGRDPVLHSWNDNTFTPTALKQTDLDHLECAWLGAWLALQLSLIVTLVLVLNLTKHLCMVLH